MMRPTSASGTRSLIVAASARVRGTMNATSSRARIRSNHVGVKLPLVVGAISR